MSTEIIAGKTFVEESYPIQDIGGGVISKGQAVRHFEKKHPEYTVFAISSFKIDHQDETISVRVQVKMKAAKVAEFGKALVAMNEAVGNVDHAPQKLLNPGYDELKEKYDAVILSRNHLVDELADTEKKLVTLQAAVADDSQDFSLAAKLAEVQKMYHELQNERDEIGAKYDALVIAVGKDAQKFSDLLVENEKLRKENKTLDRAVAGYVREKLTERVDVDLSPEDAADLADAKEALKDNDDTVPLPDGPFSESAPTAEELSEAAQEMIKNAEDEGRETL